MSGIGRTWNTVWKLGLAALIGLVSGLALWGMELGAATDRETAASAAELPGIQAEHLWLTGVLVLDFVLGALAMVLAAFRRRAPMPIAVAICLMAGLSAFSVGAFLLVVTSLGTRRRVSELLISLGAISLSVLLLELVLRQWLPFPGNEEAFLAGPSATATSVWITVLVSFALPALLGWSIGSRRELLASLRREAAAERAGREAAEARARSEERNRIAREFHDELGHRLSLIALHAGALEYRQDLDAARTHEAAGAIRRNAHEALHEVRSTLQLLRVPPETSPLVDGGGAGADRGAGEQHSVTGMAAGVEPSPDVTERLSDLAGEVRRAGSAVDLVIEVDLDQLPAGTGRHVYRIVQEGLTNALRHAPRQPVRVAISGVPGERLAVVIANPTPARAERHDDGAGVGLVGAAERVRLAGGDLRVTTGEEFVVEAWFPWAA